MKKIKRNITRYTTLLLLPVIVLLSACGNNADVDSVETAESAETVENIESDRESIKNDEVDITYEIVETQEDEAAKNSEKVEANYDTDLSPTEVYELFLNGELTVELEEEQVTIDKLFWGNDIEY